MRVVEALEQYRRSGAAIPAFNIPGFDALVGIGEAAAEADAPVIIQTSARLVVELGTETLRKQCDLVREQSGAELFLHLDHCSDFDLIESCARAGWDMVMFDGSHFPIDVNLEGTSRIVAMAHELGVAVEAEVGPIGGEEDGLSGTATSADASDIATIATSGADCLAVGFGNVHGVYADKGLLDWPLFESAYDIAELPLVLHGGTGLTSDELHRAVRAGAAKVNVSTELKHGYHAAITDPEVVDSVIASPNLLHTVLREKTRAIAGRFIQELACT